METGEIAWRMRNEIEIIHSYNIDREKWDRCVNESSNAMIYAGSAYLDHLADNWTGLVVNDYEQVMPVAWRKKFGIRYSYQIPFLQQLGIFCGKKFPDENLFLKALFSVCRYGDYPFNFGNSIGGLESFVNFILPLDESYEEISKRFSVDVIQNIRRAAALELDYQKGEIGEAIYHYKRLYGRQTGVSDEQFEKFRKLCIFIGKNDKIIVRKVSSSGGSLLAIALLPADNKRIYNVMNSTLPDGKSSEANYYLLSRLWMEFEGTGMIFDFEGSDIPGVKEFYRKFGGVNQPYQKLHFNRLPWPVNLLRK
jgi:hypothetical protein